MYVYKCFLVCWCWKSITVPSCAKIFQYQLLLVFAADACFDEWQRFNRSHIFSVFDRDTLWVYVKGCPLLWSHSVPAADGRVYAYAFPAFFHRGVPAMGGEGQSNIWHYFTYIAFITSRHRNRSVSCFCYNNKWHKVSINGSRWNLKLTKLSHHNFIVEAITLSDYNKWVMIILSTVQNLATCPPEQEVTWSDLPIHHISIIHSPHQLFIQTSFMLS